MVFQPSGFYWLISGQSANQHPSVITKFIPSGVYAKINSFFDLIQLQNLPWFEEINILMADKYVLLFKLIEMWNWDQSIGYVLKCLNIKFLDIIRTFNVLQFPLAWIYQKYIMKCFIVIHIKKTTLNHLDKIVYI